MEKNTVWLTILSSLGAAIIVGCFTAYGSYLGGQAQIEANLKASEKNLESTRLLSEATIEAAKISGENSLKAASLAAEKNLETIIVTKEMEVKGKQQEQKNKLKQELLTAAKVIEADILNKINIIEQKPIANNTGKIKQIARDIKASLLIGGYLSEQKAFLGTPLPKYVTESMNKLPLECVSSVSLFYTRLSAHKYRLDAIISSNAISNIEKLPYTYLESLEGTGPLRPSDVEKAKKTVSNLNDLKDLFFKIAIIRASYELELCRYYGCVALANIQEIVYQNKEKSKDLYSKAIMIKKNAAALERLLFDNVDKWMKIHNEVSKDSQEYHHRNMDLYLEQFLAK